LAKVKKFPDPGNAKNTGRPRRQPTGQKRTDQSGGGGNLKPANQEENDYAEACQECPVAPGPIRAGKGKIVKMGGGKEAHGRHRGNRSVAGRLWEKRGIGGGGVNLLGKLGYHRETGPVGKKGHSGLVNPTRRGRSNIVQKKRNEKNHIPMKKNTTGGEVRELAMRCPRSHGGGERNHPSQNLNELEQKTVAEVPGSGKGK